MYHRSAQLLIFSKKLLRVRRFQKGIGCFRARDKPSHRWKVVDGAKFLRSRYNVVIQRFVLPEPAKVLGKAVEKYKIIDLVSET